MLNLNEFWVAMKTRVDSPLMQEILGGRGRVYVPSDPPDDVREVEGQPNEPWGRIIMMPRETLWPQTDVPGDWQNVPWLASVQFNDFRAKGYDVGVAVGAAHRELFNRLDGWVPDPQPTQVTILLPVWRNGSPPVFPRHDQGRRLWLSNAEYRTQAVSKE